MRKLIRFILTIAAGLVAVCLVGALLSAYINTREVGRSDPVDRLSEVERARLEESVHLRRSLGNTIWQGWGEADIPIVVYNESYAFLTGFAGEPPDGWRTVPENRQRGGPWEIVPGETVLDLPYYRQQLPESGETPQAFIVRLGDSLAASMQTWEYSEIAFVSGFRRDLPGFLQPVFPYRLAWSLLLGDTETYMGALAHESFHAYQEMLAPERLADAEAAAPFEEKYPWDDDDSESGWETELDLLVQAVKAETDEEAAELARQFLAQRSDRRSLPAMNAGLAGFERKREWLEGLAKYAELAIVLQANQTPDYSPLESMTADPDFNAYDDRERFFNQQVEEVGRMRNHEGEIRFYYTGFAQALLLDRLSPGWKETAFEENVWLEDLLREAVGE